MSALLTSTAAASAGQDVCVVGWADVPPIFGVLPPGIQPQWLWWPATSFFVWDRSRGTLSDLACSQGKCPPYLMLYVPPAFDRNLGTRTGWVVVTGHLDDPTAVDCHYVYPSDWTESPLPDSAAQDQCRSAFVVTGISAAGAPMD